MSSFWVLVIVSLRLNKFVIFSFKEINMIKWAWYWKLLKQWFFTLLISCFIFLGNSFASAKVQLIWLDPSPSQYDSNYNLTFLKGWWLITSYLWQSKWFIAFDNTSFFWWTPNWKPYFYDTDSIQWFFGEYWSCDPITWLNYTPTNCSSVPIEWDYVDLFKWFFNKVFAWDFVYYSFTPYYYYSSANGSSRWNFINVCFSSSEIWKSLCFRRWYCYSSSSHWCNENYWSLVDSQNYTGLTFGNFPRSSIWLAPWAVGYWWDYSSDWDWSSNSNIDSTITWDYVFKECTVWAAKSYAENNLWLNPYVCYWWRNIDFTWISVLNPWQWSSVFDIYNASKDWKNFSDWFFYRKWIFDNRYVYNQSFWSWKEYIYDYFTLLNQYWLWLSARQVQDYCRIIVNNMSLTWKRTWIAWRCPSPFDWLPWWSWWWGGWWWGSWGDDSNWEVPLWVNRWSWQENKDTKTFIQDFFNKANSNIPTDFSDIWWWFLPTYIITFLCAVLLFKFLKH